MATAPLRGGQARLDQLLGATIDVLRETGYDRLTVDAVVARARASKTTVYRRWPTKARLVAAAFDHATALPEPPDTGSLRADLVVLMDAMHGELQQLGDVIADMLGVVRRNPDLYTALYEGYVGPRKQVVADVFARARLRGEIPADTGTDLLWQVAPAMLAFRILVADEPVDAALLRRIVDELVLPLTRPTTADGQ